MELKLSNTDELYFAEQVTSYNQGKLDRLFDTGYFKKQKHADHVSNLSNTLIIPSGIFVIISIIATGVFLIVRLDTGFCKGDWTCAEITGGIAIGSVLIDVVMNWYSGQDTSFVLPYAINTHSMVSNVLKLDQYFDKKSSKYSDLNNVVELMYLFKLGDKLQKIVDNSAVPVLANGLNKITGLQNVHDMNSDTYADYQELQKHYELAVDKLEKDLLDVLDPHIQKLMFKSIKNDDYDALPNSVKERLVGNLNKQLLKIDYNK